MNFSVNVPDGVIIVEGEPLTFDFEAPENVWAIHWDADGGTVEFQDETPNLAINSMAPYRYLVQAFYAEKDRLLQISRDQAAK